MDCEAFRELISARIDNEALDLEVAALDAHLGRCPACRAFESEAGRLRGALSVQEAVPLADRTSQILAHLGPPSRARADTIRILVGALGLSRVWTGISMLVAALGGVSGGHTGAELGAAYLAIGAGLIVASLRPQLAAGLVVVLSVLALTGLGGGIAEVVAGRASPVAESLHLLDLVGAVLVWRLGARLGRPPAISAVTA